jgi:hypothetical protein
MLQLFEATWQTIERRMPDYFIAGYGTTWLPPLNEEKECGEANEGP